MVVNAICMIITSKVSKCVVIAVERSLGLHIPPMAVALKDAAIAIDFV